MKSAFFDYEKAMHALLYVVSELEKTQRESAGRHQSFKALYFAEQEYLNKYGNTILGDTFIKMEAGPVPSHVYNLVRMADGTYEGGWLGSMGIEYAKDHIRPNGKYLHIITPPDVDYLAETEKACLDNAIAFCRNRSFTDLKKISHDSAWDAAPMNREMDTLKIAAVAGADEVTLSHIKESLANNDYCSL